MNRIFVVIHQGNFYRRYINRIRCEGALSDRPMTAGEVELFRTMPKVLFDDSEPEVA